MEELEKIAVSLQARNNKTYFQILKKMHGSTSAAMKHISRTGDIGIYHGTSERATKSILNEGLKPGTRTAYGTGAYLSDASDAQLYSNRLLNDKGIRLKLPSEATKDGIRLKQVNTYKKVDLKSYKDNAVVKDITSADAQHKRFVDNASKITPGSKEYYRLEHRGDYNGDSIVSSRHIFSPSVVPHNHLVESDFGRLGRPSLWSSSPGDFNTLVKKEKGIRR